MNETANNGLVFLRANGLEMTALLVTVHTSISSRTMCDNVFNNRRSRQCGSSGPGSRRMKRQTLSLHPAIRKT